MNYRNDIMTNSKYTTIIVAILLVILSVILLLCIESTARSYDNDLWFHLEYGKHYVEDHTWSIDHSVFSWTPATRKWTYVTWIGSSALYVVYTYISPHAVMLLPFVTLVSILLVYILFLRSIGESYSFMTLALFFIAACFFYLPTVKPAIATTLLFAASLAIYYSSRHNRNRLYWAYPPIFLIWVNTHGGFIFGLFFLICAFAIELLITWRPKMPQSEADYLRGFGAALLLSFLALSINPEGLNYLVGIYRDIADSSGVDPAQHINEFTDLWSKLNPLKYRNPGIVGLSWAGIFMLATYALLTLLGIKKGCRSDIVSIVLLVVFFLMGMHVFRLFVFFCLLWLFSITWLIAKVQPIRPSIRLTLITLAIMCYFIGNQINHFMLDGYTFHPLQHIIEDIYPVKAVEFLKQRRLPAPLIHDYGTGGYLIWALYPEYKVFVDPRGGPYRQDVMLDCFALEKSATEADVRAILVKYPEAKTAIFNLAFSNLSQLFLNMHDWRLVYFDQAVTIFVRTESYQSTGPIDLSPERFVELKNPHPLYTLFFLYKSLGSREAAQTIRKYFSRNVPPYYLFKKSYLEIMDTALIQMPQAAGTK